MPEQVRADTDGDRGTEAILRLRGDVDRPNAKEAIQAKHDYAAEKSPIFGEYGEGFVRVGLVENEHRIRQAARNVKKLIDQSGQALSRAREQAAVS